jgi:hypothetical protein
MSILSQFKQSQNTDFPNVRPSLDLRFALAKELDPRITFTRGSTGTYFGSDGIMRTAGVNEPRFDHDPITGQSLGLLIEESRSNLYLYSDSPNLAYYDPTFVAFSVNSLISPDGTQNADKMMGLSGKTFAQISQGVTITSGATVTGSVYIKYGGFNRVELVMLSNNNTTPYARATFDPSTGTITTAVSTANGGTNASANIVFVGNGWYRCNVTVTYPAVTAAGMRINATSSTGGISEGTLGAYAWGMQIEQGAFPTSYIPTTASTVTRSADLAQMTGTNFSGWYNSSEGSLFVAARVNALGGSAFPGIAYVDDGTVNNCMGFYVNDNSDDKVGAEAYISGRAQYTLFSSSATTANKLNKAISSYSINNFSAAFDTSSQIQRDTSGSIPTVNRLRLGALRGGLFPLNGTISRLTYYPIQLTNQQLINLTS